MQIKRNPTFHRRRDERLRLGEMLRRTAEQRAAFMREVSTAQAKGVAEGVKAAFDQVANVTPIASDVSSSRH